MNVCILSKFPPLEGGIAAKTYWLARAYAEAGLSVHVISNASTAEPAYLINDCYPHIAEIPGVSLHEVETEFPWHMPEEPHSLAKLVDRALEVVENHRIDVIDTGYLIPYGIAGYLVNRITGVPYVVRHGGSDLEKFLRTGRLPRLFEKALKSAAIIVTDAVHDGVFAGLSPRRVCLAPYVPDPRHFHEIDRPVGEAPVLAFIGKVNWHWKRKGLDRILRCLDFLPPEWTMHWVGQGRGVPRFLSDVRDSGRAAPSLKQFLSPWEMPGFLQRVDYLVALAIDEPIPSFSNLLAEAALCGVTAVVEDQGQGSPTGLGNRAAHRLRVVSDDPQAMATGIIRHAESRRERISSRISTATSDFRGYVGGNLAVLHDAAAG